MYICVCVCVRVVGGSWKKAWARVPPTPTPERNKNTDDQVTMTSYGRFLQRLPFGKRKALFKEHYSIKPETK